MHLHTLLAITDFSAAAEQALDRAALLAQTHQAELRLLYGADAPHPAIDHPHARLEQRARQLARRYGITVLALQGGGAMADEVRRAAASVDLLVMDRRMQYSPLRGWHGNTLVQCVRHSPCPVLVVQQPAERAYRQTLVGVDFSAASGPLVRYAGGLDREADVELFHAVDGRDEARLRSAEATQGTLAAFRQEVQRYAKDRLCKLTDGFEARRNRVGVHLGAGDPARQIVVQQEHTGADLVAVGYARRSAWWDWLGSSVSRRVVRELGCDVLIFPHDYAGPQARAMASVARGAPLHGRDIGVAIRGAA